jgi:hypothetical protein
MPRGLSAAFVTAAVALLSAWGPAQGQQLSFTRAASGATESLSYRWLDSVKREHATTFTLARRDIADAEASFSQFSLAGMWADIEANLREETAAFGGGVRIDFTRERNRLTWTASARDAAAQAALIRRLNERFERAQKAYLSRHLRQRTEEGRILVDFAAATMAQQDTLRGLARALGEAPGVGADERARVALALAFFQQIPYAGLGDGEARGSDFLTGPALLARNRGDCDSKVVALAAVLRTHVSARKLVAISMPGHVVLGIDLPALPGEQTVRTPARQYVIMEASGPHMSAIGNVDGRTAKYLADSRQIEIWPLN